MIHAVLIPLLFAQISAGLSPSGMEHLASGVQAEGRHQYAIAVEEFRQVTKSDPAAAVGFVRLGNALMENREYADATAQIKRALELDPDLPVAHQLLGYALLSQGYAAEAIPHLEKVHEAGALGIAQLQAGKPSDAIANLQAALKKSPNDPDLLYYLSEAGQMLSQQSVDMLMAAYPNSDRAHQIRGQNYFSMRRMEDAEKEYQQSLALRPDIPGLHLELGQVYAENSQWAKAEEQFLAETQLQPGNGEAAYRLGDAFLHEGKMPEAFKELERADQLHPDMSETLYDLGKAASAVGNTKAAESAWARVVAIEQNSFLAAQAHFGLAGIYRKQGKVKEAQQETEAFQRIQASLMHP